MVQKKRIKRNRAGFYDDDDELFLSEKACSKKAIKLGYSSKHIRIRIKEEYILLKRYALLLFGYFLALIYPYPIVMRNFSFYLHHTMKDYVEDESTLRHKTLYDLGHQVLPDLSQNKIFLRMNELANSFLVTAMVTLIISILFLKRNKMGQKSRKPGEIANMTNISSIGMLFRFLTMMVVGHFFRVLTYPLTSLPGPAKHCTNYTIEAINRPTVLREIFHRINSPFENCGDLLFSGHILAATTVVLSINHYLPIVTSMNKSICFRILLMILKVSVWVCLGLQIFTTIATRNHYTVDIWLATLFSYMNWTWHHNVILKRDPVIGKMKVFSNEKIY